MVNANSYGYGYGQQTNGGEKRTPYSHAQFHTPGGSTVLKDIVLTVSGFVDSVNHRVASTSNGDKSVCDVAITSYIGDSKVRRYFGEEFVNPDHRVKFRMSYWGYEAENIARMNLGQGDLVLAMLHSMDINAGTTDNGKTYRNISAKTSDGLELLHRSKQNRAEGQQNTGNTAGYTRQNSNIGNGYTQASAQNSQLKCSCCGTPVEQKVAEFSSKRFGRYLCRSCQSQGQQSQTASVPQQNGGYAQKQAPALQPELVCVSCGSAVDQRVADFSKNQFGRCLCRSCQSKPQQNPQASAASQNSAYSNDGYTAAQTQSRTRMGDIFPDFGIGFEENNPFEDEYR